jgi:hypothetical protein
MTTAGQAPGEGFTTAEDEWRPAVGAMHLGGSAAGTMNTPPRNTTWNPSQETDPAFWRRECKGVWEDGTSPEFLANLGPGLTL